MKQFHKEEFEAMTFNVHDKGDDLVAEIPHMSNCAHLVKILKTYKKQGAAIVRYICYMYDQGSPMKKHFPELAVRKQECEHLSGVDEFPPIAQSLRDMSSELFMDGINGFLRFQNHRVWSMIVANEEVFNEYQTRLLEKIDDERDKDLLAALQTKAKIMQEMDAINERLEAYYDKLYQNDSDLIAKVTFKNISPEEIAGLDA